MAQSADNMSALMYRWMLAGRIGRDVDPVDLCAAGTRTLYSIFSQANHPLLLCKRAMAMTIANFYIVFF